MITAAGKDSLSAYHLLAFGMTVQLRQSCIREQDHSPDHMDLFI
jgi:hypothetical protein